MNEPIVPFQRRDWIIRSYDLRIAQVRDIYAFDTDICMDLVFYEHDGD